MPQITFEYTSNLNKEPQDFNLLIQDIHQSLTKLPATLEACKSRIIKQEHYVIGQGSAEQAFIYANIGILPGRDSETIEKISKEIATKIKDFIPINTNLKLQILCGIYDLPKSYVKL